MKKNIYLVTKYDEVNLRNGPGLNKLVLFKILKKGYPVKVLEEFESWYKIIDYQKREGWISKTQLTKTLYGIIVKKDRIYKFPNMQSKQLALAKENYILKILKCKKDWCKIEDTQVTGWIKKESLWGID